MVGSFFFGTLYSDKPICGVFSKWGGHRNHPKLVTIRGETNGFEASHFKSTPYGIPKSHGVP